MGVCVFLFVCLLVVLGCYGFTASVELIKKV